MKVPWNVPKRQNSRSTKEYTLSRRRVDMLVNGGPGAWIAGRQGSPESMVLENRGYAIVQPSCRYF